MRKGQGRTMHARTKTRGVLIAALATLLTLVGAGTASAVVPGGLVSGAAASSSAATADARRSRPISAGAASNMRHLAGRPERLRRRSGWRHRCSRSTATRQPASWRRRRGLGGCFARRVPRRATAGNSSRSTSPTGLAITPDGASVVRGADSSTAILEFDRGAGGALTQKAGAALHGRRPVDRAPCSKARADRVPQQMAIDRRRPDLYVASSGAAGSVTALQIDGRRRAREAHERATGPAGCVSQSPTAAVDSCSTAQG